MSSAYSPDDSHRLPDPSSRSGSSTPGNGLKLLMYLVFVLALAATIIMFFVDSEVWLNVAVITSLWAAFFGAILVSRYSGVLGEERSRRQEQERRHRAEIERERSESQRRQVELENDYRTRLGGEHDQTLDVIRKELQAMREQLTDLSGADWNNEQVSLKARAERIIELERNVSRASDSSPEQPTESPAKTQVPEAPKVDAGSPERPERREAGDAAGSAGSGQYRSGGRRGGFSTGTFAAVRWSGADSEDTTQIPMVVDTRSMETPEKPADEPAQPAQPAQQEPEPQPARQEPAQQEPADQEPAPEPGRRRAAEEDEPHGRRRAGESDEGVTVAELMAQMKKNAR